jgi:hypothetical protein
MTTYVTIARTVFEPISVQVTEQQYSESPDLQWKSDVEFLIYREGR